MKSGATTSEFYLLLVAAILLFCLAGLSDGSKGFKGVKVKAPKVPLIVPVIIPVGSGYRNNYRPSQVNGGLKCYNCEGKDNDPCSLNPAGSAQRITCPAGQYCVVLRRESTSDAPLPAVVSNKTVASTESTPVIVLLDNSTSSSTATESTTTTSTPMVGDTSTSASTTTTAATAAGDTATSATESTTSAAPTSTTTSGSERSKRAVTQVLISRGCQTSDFLQGTLLASAGVSNSSYIQVCKTDLCNTGDGRLKCYQCEGTGTNHSCMTNPANVSQIVTCQADQYCTVVRTVVNATVASNATLPSNVTAEAIVKVSRGCKTASTTQDLFNVKQSNRKGSNYLSCAFDLCNVADANQLFEPKSRNSATGMKRFPSSVALILVLITIFLSSS